MNHRIFTLAAAIFTCLACRTQVLTDTIYFNFNSHHIQPRAAQKLHKLAAFILQTQGADSITIDTHCDGKGSHLYNDQLSRQRLLSVKKRLAKTLKTQQAAATEPLIAGSSHGKRQPAVPNSTAANRQFNRRAVIKIYYKQPALAPANPVNPAENTLATRLKTATPGDAPVVLRNIQFIGGRHILLPASYNELDTLLAVMVRNPGLEIEIQGHICCEADTSDGLDIDTQTNDLSLQRARAIFEYLFSNGVATRRMRCVGFGHRFPLTAERNELERQQNRRVEIKILKQ